MDLARGAGALSLSAGLIHGGLTNAHFGEWWGYGAFFALTAAAQAIFGLALVTDAYDAPRDRRRMLRVGLVGNAVVAAVYLWSRTRGVPFGPSAGIVEPVDALGLATLAAELLLVVLLGGLLWTERAPTPVGRTS